MFSWLQYLFDNFAGMDAAERIALVRERVDEIEEYAWEVTEGSRSVLDVGDDNEMVDS